MIHIFYFYSYGKATVHSESDKLNTTSGHLLDREKREVILSSTGWLDDVIINAAQDLLKEQFEISGFQNTTLGCNLSFDILRSEFVQILHNGKNHWLTTSTVGLPAATVNVYDSLNQSLS